MTRELICNTVNVYNVLWAMFYLKALTNTYAENGHLKQEAVADVIKLFLEEI